MIERVELVAPAGATDGLARFYGETLGLAAMRQADGLEVSAGRASLHFAEARDGEPYYHFALRIPGGRFALAYDWLRERATVEREVESGDRIAVFDGIRALACYLHDPVGNIVELISFHDLDPAWGDDRPFDRGDILGIAEIGLVDDDTEALARDVEPLGAHVWRGATGGPDRLAFAGARGDSLILCPTGRPWLPAGRPAEAHAVGVRFAGGAHFTSGRAAG